MSQERKYSTVHALADHAAYARRAVRAQLLEALDTEARLVFASKLVAVQRGGVVLSFVWDSSREGERGDLEAFSSLRALYAEHYDKTWPEVWDVKGGWIYEEQEAAGELPAGPVPGRRN